MSVDIEARVKRANPLTDDKQLDQLFGENTLDRFLLDVLAKQEGRMTDIKPDQQPAPAQGPPQKTAPTKRPKLRIGVAVTAFIVVIAVGIGLVYSQQTDVVASPIEISESYISARDSWDSETAVALFAQDAAMADLATTPREIPTQFDWFRATDWRWTVEECNQTNSGPPAEVTCTYTYENAWTRALGHGPTEGGSFVFLIADGKIQEFTNNLRDFPAWDVFAAWVAVNHYPDLVVLIDGCCTPRITPEAIVLWEQYTDEFVAEQ